MALYMIGIGLNDEKDITIRGLEAVKQAKKIFLETYTSILQVPLSKLEEFYGKKIISANRELVEKNSDEILKPALKEDVAFLVIGDVFSATTHTDLKHRAIELGVKINIIHNASVLTAVGITGLELYKFGKTTSIPFPQEGFEPETPYDVIKSNGNLHTLVLLDLKPEDDAFMSVNDAITYLLIVEEKRDELIFTKDKKCIGIARLGSSDCVIKYGKAKDLIKFDFGKPPHCLIIPGKLHFVEEEALEKFKI
jgi:diphthine methyl ester synthase